MLDIYGLEAEKMTAILKIRSTAIGAIHEYFVKKDFMNINSPILQSVQCGRGSSFLRLIILNTKVFFSAQTWPIIMQ
jgi:aspartyl/asparaginyl-tRNA synthetase